MVDEMFDSSHMEINDSEDSVLMHSWSGGAAQEAGSGAAAATGNGAQAPAANMINELASNDRAVHGDFYNKFGDLFDDQDLD